MATSANHSSPLSHIRSDTNVDVEQRIANALLSRSLESCHQESLEQAAFGDNAASVVSGFVEHQTRAIAKETRPTASSSSSSRTLSMNSDIEELKASSDPKLPSSKLSRQDTLRSAPGSPYSIADSMASLSLSPSVSASPYSSIRLMPSITSSFLRPGSRFEGTQQSDKQTYTVSVELKHVDMRESFLCGYLCIQGLTQDNPTLTTYFEGEMIGNKYAFKTKNKSWGANEKIDYQHWGRFPAYRPFSKASKNKDYHSNDFDQKEHIFMRWKEYFLVPNHRVKELTGASFDGFYYICFSQLNGSVSGIYFHSNSEKWQQLELKHVPDHGVYGSIEFR